MLGSSLTSGAKRTGKHLAPTSSHYHFLLPRRFISLNKQGMDVNLMCHAQGTMSAYLEIAQPHRPYLCASFFFTCGGADTVEESSVQNFFCAGKPHSYLYLSSPECKVEIRRLFGLLNSLPPCPVAQAKTKMEITSCLLGPLQWRSEELHHYNRIQHCIIPS